MLGEVIRVLDAQGAAFSSNATGVTFAIYQQQDGGAPVWMETQTVTPDASGNYSVLLGSTTAAGLPADLFSQEEQRWLGVQVEGQAEQPRVLLVSAPYALKAGDAETLGGFPPSAFVLAAPMIGAAAATQSAPSAAEVTPLATSDVTTTGGTANTIPMFTTATCASLLVYYILAAQCLSTTAVVRRETGGWKWPLFQIAYMTGLAYLCAFIVYQVVSRFVH